MDVWIHFTNATKWQAEGIFKCFFPFRPSAPSTETTSVNTPQMNLLGAKRIRSAHEGPALDELEIDKLAKRFAGAIPEGEMSVRPTSLSRALSVLTQNVRRLLAYKDICSRIRRAHGNVSRKSSNGAGRPFRCCKRELTLSPQIGCIKSARNEPGSSARKR